MAHGSQMNCKYLQVEYIFQGLISESISFVILSVSPPVLDTIKLGYITINQEVLFTAGKNSSNVTEPLLQWMLHDAFIWPTE